jgi:hypothetical protein
MGDKPEALRLAAQLEDAESARLHLLPYAAAELRRLHAVNAELLEALKECLPYVGQTLANTGSMDAYYTETKASVAIKKAEGNA